MRTEVAQCSSSRCFYISSLARQQRQLCACCTELNRDGAIVRAHDAASDCPSTRDAYGKCLKRTLGVSPSTSSLFLSLCYAHSVSLYPNGALDRCSRGLARFLACETHYVSHRLLALTSSEVPRPSSSPSQYHHAESRAPHARTKAACTAVRRSQNSGWLRWVRSPTSVRRRASPRITLSCSNLQCLQQKR